MDKNCSANNIFSQVYRNLVVQHYPLAPASQEFHCKCNGCNHSVIRKRVHIDQSLFKLGNTQIAKEASLILYTENTFAVENIRWPKSEETSIEFQDNKHIIPVEFVGFRHRYSRLIRHLDFQIYLSPRQNQGKSPSAEHVLTRAEFRRQSLGLSALCAWYKDTLLWVTLHQKSHFPDLQTLKITVTEHGLRLLSNGCGEAFVLTIAFKKQRLLYATDSVSTSASASDSASASTTQPRRYITGEHGRYFYHTPVAAEETGHVGALAGSETAELQNRPPTQWQVQPIPPGSATARQLDEGVQAMQDPKLNMLLPLRELSDVAEIQVSRTWQEKVHVKSEKGKVLDSIVTKYKQWTCHSIMVFVVDAGKDYVRLHSKFNST